MKKILTLFSMGACLFAWVGNTVAAVDLKVTVNPDPVVAGERVEYALTVTNTNASAITNVVVQDLFSSVLSVNYTHIPDGGTCPGISCQAGERITWTLGTLAGNSSRTVRFEGSVPGATADGTVISNLAELSYDGGSAQVATDVTVAGAAGLELAIADDRDPVAAGENVTYTVAFGNRGSNVLTVALRAPIPAGTTFVSATGGGSVVNGAVEWNLGTVLANSSGERQFTVAVAGGAAVGDVLQAEAQLVNTSTTTTLVRAMDTTALAGSTPVELYVTANPDPVVAGERIEYALTVTNTSAAAVTGVEVKSLIPEFVNVDWTKIPDGGTCPGSSCQAGERITWTLGTLAGNSSRTVRFEGSTAGSATAGTVLSSLTTLASDSGHATARTDIEITPAAGLELSIAEDRDPVAAGENVTYTVAFGNRGSNVLTVALRAPIPAGTTFVSATGGGSVVNGAVEWNLGTVLANSSGERQFTVTVGGGAAVGDVLQAEAQLVNTSTTTTLVRASDTTAVAGSTPVELYVTANPDPVVAGERIEYALTVTNTSGFPVTGVEVQSLIPEFVNVDWTKIPDGGTCPGSSCQAGERISWSLGTLAGNSSRTVRFEGSTAGSATAGTVLSSLTTLASDSGRATARADIEITPAAGLELSIAEDRDPVAAGENVTYTVAFGNRGSNVLTVALRAPIPAGTTFVSATGGGSVVNGAVEWNLGTVLANSSGERQFTVTVGGGAAVGDVLQAEAQLANTSTTTTLVRASDTTAVAGSTPVELYVTANPDPVVAGERIEYALTVTNTSAFPVTGVEVQSLIPEFVNVDWTKIPDGGTCPGSSCQGGERITWTLGTLAGNSSRTVRFEGSTAGSATAGTVLSSLTTLVSDVGRATARTDIEITPAAGLELSIAEDRDPVAPGENVTYTIALGNRASNALGLRLRAPIPAGTTFVSADSGGSVVSGAVQWDLSTVVADSVGERRFTVTVDSAAKVGDVLHAEALLVDAATSTTRVRAIDTTALAASTPVELYVKANPDPVVAGERIEYALTVTNTSGVPVTGLVVTDLFAESVNINWTQVPDGGACSGSSCQAGERINWAIGSLAAGESRTVRYEGTVSASTTQVMMRNQASLVHDAGRASASSLVVVASDPGLELSISDNRDPVVAGETITYTLAFGNRTNSLVDEVTLRAPVPQGTTFVSASAGGVFQSGVIRWDLKDRLTAGAVDVRRFTVTLGNGVAAGDVLHAEAQLVDNATSSNLVRSEAVTGVVGATPQVRLASGAEPEPGDASRINYSLTVTNTDTVPATGVVVQDLFPQFVTVSGASISDSGTCPGGTCQAGERISWDIGSLAAGESRTLSYQAVTTFSIDNGPNLRNRASVAYDVGFGSADLDTGFGVVIDGDEDGLPDSWELAKFGNTNPTTGGDFDQDDLSNFDEYQNKTEPKDSDTDNDGLEDGFEVGNNFDPLDPADAGQDSDNDGYTNLEEFDCGSDPRNAASFCITGGLPRDEIVVDFGGIGLWSWTNDTGWLKLNNSSPEKVAIGDVDGNGVDDVIADFSSTFGGIFIKRNLGPWLKLHNFTPELLATGDLDNNGTDDVVVDFGGIGLWARMNDTSWLKLNNSSPDQIVVGDMDGNGQDDVIADFTSTFGGIFVKRNQGGWAKLHNFSPEALEVGDLDNNGKDDLVIDFGAIGLWARMNDSSWLKLNNSSPDRVATGDLDGNGADDVLATYGSTIGGLWQKINLGGWSQLNPNAPDEVVTGDVDGSGHDDVIGKFGSTLGGIFVKRNQGAWVKLHNTSPDSLATGNLDGN